jgi:sterol desaturase/sphingolipid hydroxylase (fatty acid hydroxylase superfamily)
MWMVYATINASGSAFPVFILLCFLTGLFLWTLAEYTLHRLLFHYKPTNLRQEHILFLFHGIHHVQPQAKPVWSCHTPSVSRGLSIFFGLFYLILAVLLKAPQWVAPLMSGFMIGYLAYDLTHYATHHFPMRWRYAKDIKRYHHAASL